MGRRVAARTAGVEQKSLCLKGTAMKSRKIAALLVALGVVVGAGTWAYFAYADAPADETPALTGGTDAE